MAGLPRILKYGNEDDVLLASYSHEMNIKTSNQFAVIIKSAEKQSYNTLKVMATPLTYHDGTFTGGKTANVKVTQVVLEDGVLTHVITLPKLPKNKPYQLYRVDFVIDGKTVSRVVGLEQPVE